MAVGFYPTKILSLKMENLSEFLKNNNKQSEIATATTQEQRIQFHAMVQTTAMQNAQTNNFLNFVSQILPSDKFALFKNLFRFPLPTNDLCKVVFDKLQKVFDAKDKSESFLFRDEISKFDFETYKTKLTSLTNTVWQTLKYNHNSIMIVDMPQDSNDAYYYILPICNVCAIETDNNNITRIAYKLNDGFVYIDAEQYIAYTQHEDNIKIIAQKNHSLGYCPACFVSRENISVDSEIIKRSVLSEILDDLDWYLLFLISKRQLDLYGAYPIYSGYEVECDYTADNGDYCEGGFLKDIKGQYLHDAYGLCKCPKCGNKRFVGVGSFVEIPVPTEGQPDLRNPVQMLSVDRNSLEYNNNELQRLKENIIVSCTGASSSTITTAINEKQVQSIYADQQRILINLKKQIEYILTWTYSTICRLKYGDAFLSCNIDLGTEFFLATESELRQNYKIAKDNGATQHELKQMQNNIISTAFKNNPRELQRQMYLSQLEPMPTLTINEVQQLYKDGIVSREKLILKTFFNDVIRDFENENGDIIVYGSELNKENKLQTIKLKLNEILKNYDSKI